MSSLPDSLPMAGQGLRSASFKFTPKLPIQPLSHLCHALQEIPAVAEGARIVAFTQPMAGEASGRIAFETAYAAATQMGLRVLFVDTLARERRERSALVQAVATPLARLLPASGAIEECMVAVAETRLAYMLLGKLGAGGLTLADLDIVGQALHKLRGYYDLIVIDAPAILDGAFAVGLIKLGDGGILVVQAERTRAPVALQAKQVVHAAGGRIVGAVLNNRRFYIPRWIYRWL